MSVVEEARSSVLCTSSIGVECVHWSISAILILSSFLLFCRFIAILHYLIWYRCHKGGGSASVCIQVLKFLIDGCYSQSRWTRNWLYFTRSLYDIFSVASFSIIADCKSEEKSSSSSVRVMAVINWAYSISVLGSPERVHRNWMSLLLKLLTIAVGWRNRRHKSPSAASTKFPLKQILLL